MVAQTINMAMRGLQFLWALLVIALVGNMIATASGGNPSIVNYSMFCAVFAMLALLYLIPTTVKPGYSFHPLLAIGLDTLNMLFWFCAAVAMAAYLGVHSCNNGAYTKGNGITNGSPNTHKRCTEAQASTAFLWFGFAAWAVSAVFSLLESRGHANVRSPMGGVRRGPTMSQV